jgi:hypothetical protein
MCSRRPFARTGGASFEFQRSRGYEPRSHSGRTGALRTFRIAQRLCPHGSAVKGCFRGRGVARARIAGPFSGCSRTRGLHDARRFAGQDESEEEGEQTDGRNKTSRGRLGNLPDRQHLEAVDVWRLRCRGAARVADVAALPEALGGEEHPLHGVPRRGLSSGRGLEHQ